MARQSTAATIRDHIRRSYIEPARSRHAHTVRIVAGDVHKALHLQNLIPAVCQVLRGRKLLEENDLAIEKQEGPPSGLGTTVAIVYRLDDHSNAGEDADAAWKSLRGMARGIFPAGAEEFLRQERRSFYGSSRFQIEER